jgi:DNA recombination-dependent growth factor C
MEKTLTEATQLLQKISKAVAMRRDWETRLAGALEYNQSKKKCAEFSNEATRKSQKGSQSRESLKESTSSQELPRALTSPNQMKQPREACQA